MPYVPNTAEDQQSMLEAIGIESLDDLFDMVPAELRLDRELCLPQPMGEIELTAEMTRLSAKNMAAACVPCFLGGGCYDHFVPAVVDVVSSRSEFYTSYTPYQAEAAQGNLQAMFEYQTLICQLTGMDVSNASLYDGASATAEAAMMAIHTTRRSGSVVVPASLHPEYREVLATYLANMETELVTVGTPDGTISPEELQAVVNDQTACVIVQHPNFFGCLEDVDAIGQIARNAGAAFVVAVDPISLGLLKRPGDYGADIVVAEGQPLGIPMSFGGPFLGIMACTEKFMRRMPGRLVGQTTDRRDRRCWVLTLQTREQHIRRDKATSNICTNQGLYALRAAVYLSLMGPKGMRQAAELCLQKSHYAAEQLTAGDTFSMAFEKPTFKEFVVRASSGNVDQHIEAAAGQYIFAGVPLSKWYPDLADCMLVAVTEKRTQEEIDRLVTAVTK